MELNTNFILIDDSKMDLFLMDKVIKTVYPESPVMSFEQPDKAVEYFRENAPPMDYTVFLDINMPVISGFQFLEFFDTLDENRKQHYRIYIITSSHNVTDIERGKSNKYVIDVLTKPLSKDILLTL